MNVKNSTLKCTVIEPIVIQIQGLNYQMLVKPLGLGAYAPAILKLEGHMPRLEFKIVCFFSDEKTIRGGEGFRRQHPPPLH